MRLHLQSQTRQMVLLLTFILLLAVCALAQQTASYAHVGQVVLPDHKVTPGQADKSLTAAKLCSSTFTTKDERHVTAATKRQVCQEYGIDKGCPGPGYEIDHLISIELGGAEDIANLWPQPVDAKGIIGFHTKDKVENSAHRAVCAGKLTLRQAQQGISGNWYRFAEQNELLPEAK